MTVGRGGGGPVNERRKLRGWRGRDGILQEEGRFEDGNTASE